MYQGNKRRERKVLEQRRGGLVRYGYPRVREVKNRGVYSYIIRQDQRNLGSQLFWEGLTSCTGWEMCSQLQLGDPGLNRRARARPRGQHVPPGNLGDLGRKILGT
jgi:hypothetical protein